VGSSLILPLLQVADRQQDASQDATFPGFPSWRYKSGEREVGSAEMKAAKWVGASTGGIVGKKSYGGYGSREIVAPLTL
jgi:hypothetical protein